LHPARSSVDARRRAAVVLARVDAEGAHAARLLGSASALERELVLGCLRWQRVLDELLARHLRQPLAAVDAEVRAVLRVGLYEALRLRTPRPVAVSEAVRVARMLAPRAHGLVNAVLRRAAGEAWPTRDDESLPLALRFSHPDWLVARWLRQLGERATRAALAANQEPAPLCLLAGAADAVALAAAGCRLEPHARVPGMMVASGEVAPAVAALRAGRAYALDPTAAAVARLLPETNGIAADLAAAPGGKVLVLALERPHVRMLAADRRLGRAALMRRALAPTGTRVIVADALAPPLHARSLGAVLLDAPCSGTGTLRRHPEIRWRLHEEDLERLAGQQRAMAAAAAELVAPGGYLLYATCSLEPEENAAVVAGLGLEPVSLAGSLPAGMPRIELASGGVVIPPDAHGDGFTVHLLRRS
jgi:16S rRNA (cytosine967-C5)-methyltransferase